MVNDLKEYGLEELVKEIHQVVNTEMTEPWEIAQNTRL